MLCHLAVVDVLWCGLLEFHIPHQRHTVWLMGCIFIVVVGSHQKLRVLKKTVMSEGGRERDDEDSYLRDRTREDSPF